jgi:hypothetical protein
VTRSEAVLLGEEAAGRLARTGEYEIAAGLTDTEIAGAEREYGFEFADDHKAFLQAGLPLNNASCAHWPDWRHGDPADLRDQLDRPVEGALFDVERNALWHPTWGARPESMKEALETAREHLAQAPKMIPVHGHLADYITQEFTGSRHPITADWTPPALVPFWSDFL